MKEITPKKEYKPPEIRVIDPKRPALAWEEIAREDPQPIRKIGLEITAGVSLALNVIFAVIIYLMIPAVR